MVLNITVEVFADLISAQVKLDTAGGIGQVKESGFAHQTQGSDAPGEEDGMAVQTVELSDDLSGWVGNIEPFGGERVAPRRTQIIEFLPADRVDAISWRYVWG